MHQNEKFDLTKQKYYLGMLQETRLLECKLETSPMEAYQQF